MQLEPGARVDRYELLCHLARGGMADVWLARLHSKPTFEKLFAVKTILPSEAENGLFRDMFLDEARLVSRIDHPNVVRVTDVGEHCAAPYLVMEFIEGESLDKIVREVAQAGQRVPLGIALRIVADACRGLAAAHELVDAEGAPLNVVHRDVSPQNILVTTAGLAKVIDFGIAKGRDRSADKTSFGTLKGKITYMPPEQAMGKDVDARADTWALGAVLYFLFAGRPPHKAESELATLRLAMNGAPIPPLPDSVPARVGALVMRALASKIDERFQTAAEMATAIEAVMHDVGAVASHADVAAFVKQAVGERLGTRRAVVTTALTESIRRESQRIEAAIPVDLDLAVEDAGAEAPPTTGSALDVWSRSAPRSAPPEERRRRLRTHVALVVLAATCLVLAGLVATGRADRGSRAPKTAVAAQPAAERATSANVVPTAVAPAAPPPTATSTQRAAPHEETVTAEKPAKTSKAKAAPSSTAAAPAKLDAKSQDDEAGF